MLAGSRYEGQGRWSTDTVMQARQQHHVRQEPPLSLLALRWRVDRHLAGVSYAAQSDTPEEPVSRSSPIGRGGSSNLRPLEIIRVYREM